MLPLNQSGQGIVVAIIAAFIMVGTLVVYIASRTDAQTQAREQLQLQLGAITMMEEIALIVRQSYDASMARRASVAAGPTTCSDSTDPVRTKAYDSPGAGSLPDERRLCHVLGPGSCVRHPLDRADMSAQPSLPMICLDAQANIDADIDVMPLNISFQMQAPRLDQWSQVARVWFRHGDVARAIRSGLLGKAHASTGGLEAPRDHLPGLVAQGPRIAQLTYQIDQPAAGMFGTTRIPFAVNSSITTHAGGGSLGDYFRVCRGNPSPTDTTGLDRRTNPLDEQSSVCYTISVCLKAGGGCSASELFRQRIALTR